jgi:hypothetical protein
MLKTFMDCPSKFYLRYILGLVRAYKDHSDAAKFDWGTCWHHVMEAYYSNDLSLKHGLVAMETNYPAYITPTQDKYNRSKERMAEAFFAYDDKWRSQNEEYDILRNEQFFDVYSEEEDLRWAGRVDQIRRRKRTKKLRVWDHKTASAMGDLYFTSHELGFQFPGYVWSTDQVTPGEVVEEITVDVMYMISKTTDFFRRTFRFDAFRKAEWIRNVKGILSRMNYMMDNHIYNPGAWDLNWNECTRYGACTYLGVHNTAPRGDTRLRVLSNDFKIMRWDPRRGTSEGDEE